MKSILVPVDDGSCLHFENSSLEEKRDFMLSSLMSSKHLGPPTDEQESEIPLFCIEQMSQSFQSMPYRRDLHQQGGLFPGRLCHIRGFCKVRRALKGFYLSSGLEYDPHYEVLDCQDDEIDSICHKAGIPVKDFFPDQNYLSDKYTDFRIYNGSGDETLDKLHEQLPLKELIIETLQHGDHDEDRNTFMRVVGYASNMSTKVVDGVAKPTFRGGPATEPVKQANVILSTVARCMYSTIHKAGEKDIFDDPDRQKEYAGSEEAFHSKGALLEALACSVQISDENLLSIHADHHNDYTEVGRKHNYNYTVVAWAYFTIGGIKAKFTIIGYMRASVTQHMYRREVYREYFTNVVLPFFNRIGPKRKNLDHRIFEDEDGDKLVESLRKKGCFDICRAPHKDKNLYYSPYTDALSLLRRRYQEFTGAEFTIYRFSEALLPIIFCNGPSQYDTILRTWADCKGNLPAQSCNYTLQYMVEALNKFKFPNLGSDPRACIRHQPTFNHAVARRWIDSSLKVLLRVLVKCNRADKKKRPSFEEANIELQDIAHVGGLASNHLLHILALCLVIPSYYADHAIVSKTTRSSDRLRTEHGITNKKGLITFLQEEGIIETESIAENAGVCEALRQPDHPYVDTIFSEQSAVYQTNPKLYLKEDEEYLIKVIPRPTDNGAPETFYLRGRLCLSEEISPADRLDGYHWSEYNGSDKSPPDPDAIIQVNNKKKQSVIRLIPKIPAGVKKMLKYLKKTKTRVYPEATPIGRDSRSIANALKQGITYTDAAKKLCFLALLKVIDEGGEVIHHDEELIDEDEIYRTQISKALEDSELYESVVFRPDQAWDAVLSSNLQARMVYEYGIREQYGRVAKPIGDTFPPPTQLYNKNVRLAQSRPKQYLRVSADSRHDDSTSIDLAPDNVCDKNRRHSMSAVLEGKRRFTFETDYSSARHFHKGLSHDSGSLPSFRKLKHAKDALCWYLITQPERKGSPEWPFKPHRWLRCFFGTMDKWVEWCPNGPRYVILGNHRNTVVRGARKKRKANREPEMPPAPTNPSAQIIGVMRHYNDEVRIAFVGKDGKYLKPFVIAEDFVLADPPIRKNPYHEEGVPDLIGVKEFHKKVDAMKEAKKEQGRLLWVAFPPPKDEPKWEEEKGEPPSSVSRFWPDGWRMRVIMRRGCSKYDSYYDCPHTRITIRSLAALRTHLRYICGAFTSSRQLAEKIKDDNFVWGHTGSGDYNEAIKEAIKLMRRVESKSGQPEEDTSDGAEEVQAQGT